jgi:hypothetical protein
VTPKLHLADDFALPLEAVTQTFAVLAKRGVGKTYCASVMAEEMLAAGQQLVCIDPVGAMWGLRSEYPIAVLGGEHGDVMLEESAGELIAQSIVEGGFSAVLDLSLFRKGQMQRFMTPFLETLYRLNRQALHLFVDEADAFAPQRSFGDENRLLGAMEDIVRRGRKRGIGCTLISQRPAVLNKNVLTQAEVLIALRLVHPKDIDAVREWVNVHADPDRAQEMEVSLPSLPIGTAWFWSPGWGDIFRKVKIRQRRSFDSGATPKPGETAKAPKRLASIDLAALGERIKATVEKAKENDPRELKRRIAELEKQLRERPAEQVQVEKIVEVPVLKNGMLERTQQLIDRMESEGAKVVSAAAELRQQIAPAFAPRPVAQQPKASPAPHRVWEPKPKPEGTVTFTRTLGKAERLILTALAQHGVAPKNKVALLAGYAVSGGGFNNSIGSLRSKGLIEGSGDALQITAAGASELGHYLPLPTGLALLDHWYRQLGKAEREALRVLADIYPQSLSKEQLAERAGYAADGGGFNNALGRLRTLELIEGGRGELRAAAALFWRCLKSPQPLNY